MLQFLQPDKSLCPPQGSGRLDTLKEAFVRRAICNHSPLGAAAGSGSLPPPQTCHSPPRPGWELGASTSQSKQTFFLCDRGWMGTGEQRRKGRPLQMSAPLQNPSAPSHSQSLQATPAFSKGHPEPKHRSPSSLWQTGDAPGNMESWCGLQ